MAAARPSAHNAEFRVFILVLRRLRPVFVVPRARLRVRRESPPAAGLGEWQTACRRREKWRGIGDNFAQFACWSPLSGRLRLARDDRVGCPGWVSTYCYRSARERRCAIDVMAPLPSDDPTASHRAL